MTVWLQVWSIILHGLFAQSVAFPGPGLGGTTPPIALVTFTYAGALSGNTANTSSTTGPVDMTGANLLVTMATNFNVANSCIPGVVVADSSSNTWVGSQNGAFGSNSICAYTVQNPTVSSSQTFSCTGSYIVCIVMGFKNVKSAGGMIDVSIGNGTTGQGITQSTLTPTKSNELCVAGVGNSTSGNLSASFAFPGGSYIPVKAYEFMNSETGGAAYWVQTTATATAPVWSDTGAGTGPWMAVGICFFSPNSR